MRSNIIIVAGLLLLAAIVMATLSPARFKADKTLVTDHGIVAEVYETALKDLVVKLQGRDESYYIDRRANAEGMSFDQFKNKLMNKPVMIHYLEGWSPIEEQEPRHYVSKLEHEGEIVFYDDEE
jgi:hypothetical protein